MATLLTISFILVVIFFNILFAQQPNILFIYVDDIGFNDFGFNKNTQTQTPFIDNLVQQESLLIDRNYVSFVCSPTRAQMLSGRYASHLGLQHNVFTQNAPYSLTRQVSLLSNEFQSHGYSTHLIGKYHLGFQAWEYTPTYRGFDTFSGFYNGEETYFSHMAYVKDTDLIYYDLREDEQPNQDITQYSVYMQRDKCLTLLNDIYETDNVSPDPYFIYLAFQAAHFPPQAPIEYASLYCDPLNSTTNIDIIKSKVPYKSDDDESNGDIFLTGNCTSHDLHMAQMTSIDDAMQIIVNKMKQMGLWDNVLVIVSSDNGAVMFSGDNAPLRGGKTTPFEGGIRVPGFITGGYLNENRRGQILNEFPVHVTDWYPTLLSAASMDIKYERSKRLYTNADMDTKWNYIEDNNIEITLDGKDIWNAIQYNEITDELINREILLHLDEIDCPYDACGALVYGEWKYIRGPYVCDGSYKCGWNNAFMTDPHNNILGCPMISNHGELTDLIHQTKDSDSEYDWSTMTCFDGCLFHLSTDPCEMYDVKIENKDIVDMMQNKLLSWQMQSVMPLMGEQEIYLDDNEINPNIVCDSEYWCPYMEYDDVQFEQVLYGEYMRIYGSDGTSNVNDDDMDKMTTYLFGFDDSVMLRIIGIFTLFGISCMVYNKLCKRYTHADIKQIHRESSPLL